MAGARVTVPSVGATDWTEFITVVERMRRGFMSLMLTNLYATTEPQIAAGSVVEIDSTLYQFLVNESITGWAGIGDASMAFIKLTAAGASVTASWEDTNGTWSDAKQGYYDGSDRFIGGCYRTNVTTWTDKWIWLKRRFIFGGGFYVGTDNPTTTQGLHSSGGIRTDEAAPYLKTKVMEIGDWNMDASGTKTLTHGLDPSKIRYLTAIIYGDVGTIYENGGVPINWSYHSGGVAKIAGNIGIKPATNTLIEMERTTGETFDGPFFDATSFNRGWVIITYEA